MRGPGGRAGGAWGSVRAISAAGKGNSRRASGRTVLWENGCVYAALVVFRPRVEFRTLIAPRRHEAPCPENFPRVREPVIPVTRHRCPPASPVASRRGARHELPYHVDQSADQGDEDQQLEQQPDDEADDAGYQPAEHDQG